MPELKDALLFLMRTFEADKESEWGRGLQAWLGQLRSDPGTVALAWPDGLFDDEAKRASIACRDASVRVPTGSRPSSYVGADWPTRRDRSIVYAATARAVADLTATMGRNSLFEVAHNAAFFAHLASTLWTYRVLEGCPDDGPRLYWADLASEKTERDVGGDFAFIAPLDERRCKIAIVQAKREGKIETAPTDEHDDLHRYIGSGFADVSHEVRSTKRLQINLLHAHDSSRTVTPRKDTPAFFGAWCFYVFWHRPGVDGAILPPLVRSVRDIRKRAAFNVRGKERLKGLSGVPTSLDAVDLTTFLALHLPDPDSGVGLVCDRSDLPGLVGMGTLDIRTLALVASPNLTWPLGYWTSLLEGLPNYANMTPRACTRPPMFATPGGDTTADLGGGAPSPNRR